MQSMYMLLCAFYLSNDYEVVYENLVFLEIHITLKSRNNLHDPDLDQGPDNFIEKSH